MAEHQSYTAAPWRSADAGADSLVVASWVGVIALALVLLQPLKPPRPDMSEIVPVAVTASIPRPAAAVNAPDFYPWARPSGSNPVADRPVRWTPPLKPRTGGFLTRLTAPARDPVFFASSHGNAESFYGGDWRPENIDARGGGAFLEVKRENHGGLPFTAAEMQSQEAYQYGRYEVIMQPARGSGLVTAFFTYTGPWFGDPHDEIDIEFLGSDTTKIHFNYFRNGKKIKPATFDLPFDAADRPRLYAFEWRPDSVTWFVDGVPVYAVGPEDGPIPQAAGKVMFSTWTGKPVVEGWHGKPTFPDGSGTQINCVSFTLLGHETPGCSNRYDPATRTGISSGSVR